ncbi:KUP/HAK/KT family potassium transporter [Burkholderiaceae bacterium FT117]|uniref:potassium transporter Kup n=1 Tax=Zeimonas sediminis TaxID=2944268 RepID=UPI002342D11D|nr:KUP/HAK/KT family potassium transporter [Zeimonas sediminis]MCM5568953.1 KUP/HAK/KT family potassium transporter [Zeimonas sediminis]
MSKPARTGLPAIALAALGVVFADIGTSPLYAFREAFRPGFGIPLTPANVFAVLSMIFWTVTLIVSLKYVAIMLRFDNRGEGGVLAMLSWCMHRLRASPRMLWLGTVLGILAVSLFYGDAVITPAISVLAAVEGLAVARPALAPFVLPVALTIVVAVFLIQRGGTDAVGALFGPLMLAWFATLAVSGGLSVLQTPDVLWALDPRHALGFVVEHPGLAFVAAGAVFLCVTGVEALYADLGQFGPKPVRLTWFAIVLPALTLNYFGQGALVLRNPGAVHNPFFLLVPPEMVLPLTALAIAAAVIASLAVISGAFSATQQASRMNFLPRLRVIQKSRTRKGRIYIPVVNWLMLALVVFLMLEFRDSGSLAAAYGIAVSGDLLLASVLMLVTLPRVRGARSLRLLWLPFAVFALVEGAFLAANATKVLDGGWFPLLLAMAVFTVLTTWRRGIDIMRSKKRSGPRNAVDGLAMDLSGLQRVPGVAVFFSSSSTRCPSSFLHNLKHNGVVHETTIFLTAEFEDVPLVPEAERVQVQRGANGVIRLTAHLGYREDPDIQGILRLAARKGLVIKVEEASFFTSKPTVVSVSQRGLFGWRRSLFGWMLQNSTSVANYFRLPADRVIEVGTQVAI